jgi:hypothetical protein
VPLLERSRRFVGEQHSRIVGAALTTSVRA